MPRPGPDGRRAIVATGLRAQGGVLRSEERLLDLRRDQWAFAAARGRRSFGRCWSWHFQLRAGRLGRKAQLAQSGRTLSEAHRISDEEAVCVWLHGFL